MYKWNRKYPSDVTFPVAMLDNYQLENVSEFEGNSHDKITEEIMEEIIKLSKEK